MRPFSISKLNMQPRTQIALRVNGNEELGGGDVAGELVHLVEVAVGQPAQHPRQRLRRRPPYP